VLAPDPVSKVHQACRVAVRLLHLPLMAESLLQVIGNL